VAADLSTLKMEVMRSFKTSVHARSTQRHIPEDDILQSLMLLNYIVLVIVVDPIICGMKKKTVVGECITMLNGSCGISIQHFGIVLK
jgi:hypothetical protein